MSLSSVLEIPVRRIKQGGGENKQNTDSERKHKTILKDNTMLTCHLISAP